MGMDLGVQCSWSPGVPFCPAYRCVMLCLCFITLEQEQITNFAVSRLSGRRHIKDTVPNACMLSHFRCV